MDHNQIATVYDDIHDWHAPELPFNDPHFAYLVSHLPTDRNIDILDAGCGSGVYAFELAKRGYGNVTAVDLFDEIRTNDQFTYQQSSIDDLSAADESFDFIYSWSVIYYLSDMRQGLQEFWRVMRPGATLLLSAHTKHSLFTYERRLLRSLGRVPHLKGINFPTAEQITELAEGVGFQILDVDGYRLCWVPSLFDFQWARLMRQVDARRGRTLGSKFPESPAWLKRLRSKHAYHFVIAARKTG